MYSFIGSLQLFFGENFTVTLTCAVVAGTSGGQAGNSGAESNEHAGAVEWTDDGDSAAGAGRASTDLTAG